MKRSEKISRAMKKKWAEIEYRQKTMDGMEKYRDSLPPKPVKIKKPRAPRRRRRASSGSDDGGEVSMVAAMPMTKRVKRPQPKPEKEEDFTVMLASTMSEGDMAKKRMAAADNAAKRKVVTAAAATLMGEAPTTIDDVSPTTTEPTLISNDTAEKKKPPVKKKKKKKNDGDVDRMREERRDLYDLLYGDETEKTSDSGTDGDQDGDDEDGDDEYNDDGGTVGGLYNEDRYETSIASQLDDENLDNFDPYGLEDF